MRLRVSGLRRVVKRSMAVEFGREQLSSYGGLELVRQYFAIISLNHRLRQGFRQYDLGGDYGCAHLVVLVVGLLMVGARRLKQLRYVADDPLFARLCGLARIPADRTVVKWLKEFTQASLAALVRINSELLYDQIRQLGLRRLTIDIDGTVIRTGNKVAWAMHGFNPHHPKDPSYYPLLAHLAQTGQILQLKNRPGNVHDSKGAEAFLRELIDGLRARFGRSLVLEFRMDAAFFQENLLKLLERRGCFYAVKVPFCQWTGVRAAVAAQPNWAPVQPQIGCFETKLRLKAWALELRTVVFRKRVAHESRRNYQLDLFSPDDGHFEYSAAATNLTLKPRALWSFMAGRGAQEKSRVASGIAPRGSHGSGRAELPHPALRPTALLHDGGVTDARLRERIALPQPVHVLPRNPCPLRAAAQPLAPRAVDSEAKAAQRPEVSGDTKIPKVPQQLPLECCPLLANRFMPVSPTPVRDALESPPEAVSRRLLLHHPVSLAGLRPVMGEPQQVKGAGPGVHIAVIRRRQAPPVRSPKVDQPGLFRMKRQTVLRQSLWQHLDDTPRILLSLEDDDKVSGGGESHPSALAEPDVSLATHPAPIVQPCP